jgi:hypothetical protein
MPMAWDAAPVIDLDVGAQPDVASPRLGRAGAWRSWRYRIAVPLGAILLLIGAAAPAATAPYPQVAKLSVGDGASLLVHGTRAYVLEIDGSKNMLRSYPLDGHGHRWAVPVAELPAEGVMRATGSVIVVSMNPEQVTGPIHTEAFDAASGRLLWRSRYGAVGLAGADVILESMISFPLKGTPSAVGGWIVERAASRTGRTVWQAGIPLGCNQAFVQDPADGMPDGMAELCSDAPVLRMLDLSTGTQRAVRDVPIGGRVPALPPQPAEKPMPPQMMVYGGVVVVTHVLHSVATIDAFRGADLSPAWPSIPYAPWQEVTDCDDHLCLLSNTEPTVIDPQTGMELHGQAAKSAITPRSSGVLIAGASTRDFHSVWAVGDGIAETVPTPDIGSAWIKLSTSTTGLEQLPGVGPNACIQMDHYLACSPSLGAVTLWHIP